MTLVEKIKQSVLTVSFVLLFTVAITFGLASESSFAATLGHSTPNQLPLAAMDRVGAVGKNLEGKAQEAIGNLTGDPKDQVGGKAKQAQSQSSHVAAEMRENVKVQGRTKAIGKNFEGKTQEAIGNLTGDPKNQAAGKAKQGESQARNAVEDVKEKIQDIFN